MFSGIGGFDLALQRTGHEIIGACEIDKYAREIYARHFPRVPIHEDATKINPEELQDFDILVGGFPCQAFSVAGKKLGFDDPRGNLFFEIARIAKEKRPRYLFLENVRGLLSHDKGETFREMLRILDEVGHDAEWQVINSKYFVPQNRERVFIIGHLRGECTRQVFPLGEIPERNNISQQETCGKRERVQNQISGTIDANYHKGYGSRTMIVLHQSDNQQYRVYDPKGISPKLGVGHAMQSPNIKQKRIRRLTPTECERLQGFPDNYTKYGIDGKVISDTQRYKCLGNAVTVPVIEYISSHLDL